MTTPPPDPNDGKPSRRKRNQAAEEAHLALTHPIANWQAKFAWACACWGLIPVAGLPLGALGVLFGILGWCRVRLRPDDLGLRHAVGGIIVGGVELLCNAVGFYFVAAGLGLVTH
ncbi:MAG: hypothetical protein ACJ8F7_04305 [Gemmataceae bacterium]